MDGVIKDHCFDMGKQKSYRKMKKKHFCPGGGGGDVVPQSYLFSFLIKFINPPSPHPTLQLYRWTKVARKLGISSFD